MLSEDLSKGQTIMGYSLELQDSSTKSWTTLTLDPMLAGRTVGGRNIVQLPNGLSNASAVRFKCTRAIQANDKAFGATLATFSLHRLVQPPAPPPAPGKLRSYRSKMINDTAPCSTRDRGSCATFTSAGYSLVREEAVVLSSRQEGDAETKWAHLVYSVTKSDNGLADVIAAGGKLDPLLQPSSYADEGAVDKMAVYTKGGAGRVEIVAYYSAARHDFWALASSASKAEAEAQGYTRVASIGWGLTP